MTFVVNDACIRCKYMDCVAVCPVDCFHEGATMLVIDPDDCVDCGACWVACPASAIQGDYEKGVEPWLDLNRRFAPLWPTVVRKNGQTPPDADVYREVPGKFDKYFSPEPGRGN
jgi:ferredoxin